MRIQLPTNATYIDGDYTYDATTHSIFRTATPFFTNGSSVRKFTIKFNGMQNGDPIIEPSEVVISAIESDGTSKVFTGAINWNGATISTPTRRVTENGYNPK